ncbi:MAG: histidine kinase [Saprospiraceae bacterium]
MNRRILLHIGFWIAYALYDGYLCVPLSGTSFEHLSMGERLLLGYQAELVLLAVKIPAAYLVLNYLLPRSFQNRKFLRFGLQVAVLTALVSLALYNLWHKAIYPHIFKIEPPAQAANNWIAAFRLLWSSFEILMLLSVASAIKLFRMRLQTAQREKQLIEEKLQSELSFLRAQTNPHFLFNTLNNLYHLARKKAETTPDAILKLSGMLRFMLYECATPRIQLSQEIQVIGDYLELERLRYGDRLKVAFRQEVDDAGQPIAPLLLLPLVENAFKHGAAESTGQPLVSIFLELKKARLHFKVENSKEPATTDTKEGIGLKNIRRQLELLYPEHQLLVEDNEDRFSVILNINLAHVPA